MANTSDEQYIAGLQKQLQQLQIKQMSATPEQYKLLAQEMADLRQQIAYIQSFGR